MKMIWKKALAALLAAILTAGIAPTVNWLAVIAAAQPVSGTCGADGDNLTWSLDTDTGVLTVTGAGDMADYDDEDDLPPWAEHADSIQTVTIGEGVTSIGEMAFFGCAALTDVTIGEDVTRIGEQAFTLSSLTEVYVPSAVQEIGLAAFSGLQFTEDDDIVPITQRIDVDPANETYSSKDGILYDKAQQTLIAYPCGSSVSSFEIPNSVTTIAPMAFAYCLFLESVTLPENLTEIGETAFAYCFSLESILIPGSVSVFGERIFEGCFSLRSVTFESGITEIPDDLFAECESLETATLPDSIRVIHDNAFSGCVNLADLTLGRGVESIGANAFYSCENLTSLTIPAGVREIGSYAFYGCSGVTSLTFNAVDCADINNAFLGCNALQTLTIGSSVIQIPAGAFTGLEGITAVEIPNSVTQIGAQAFLGCGSLADVTIGNSVVAIGDSAFQSCSALTSMHIPAGVTSIGNNVFEYCNNLAYICSDSADSTAKTYAEANGIEFRLCSGHSGGEEPTNTVSGVCGAEGDNVMWTLDLDTGVMTISGTGAMADFTYSEETYTGDAPWTEYQSVIRGVTIENSVTSVGDYAFHACTSLADVTLADSVTAIGASSFAFCPALEHIEIPGSVTQIGAFAFEVAALSDVTIPASVQQIGEGALVCGSYADNTLVPSLLSVNVDPENDAFASQDGVLYDKTKTTLIQYPCGRTDAAFRIPDGVTTVGAAAFAYCPALQNVTFADTVTSVGEYAFADTGLVSVTIPGGVTAIGSYAFEECGSLASVSIGSVVARLEEGMFSQCAALTDVTLPTGLTAIGDWAFCDCAALAALTIPDGVTTIGKSAFSGAGLTSVTLPNSVTQIGTYAFANCANLLSIHIPPTAAQIGENVLANCANLAFICCDTATGYAKTYAGSIGVEFRLCTGHDNAANTVFGMCGAEGDNVLWALNLGSGEMILSGTGNMADYASADDTPWAEYRASIQTVTVQSGVTNIGDNAFNGCVPLSDATIGGDVTSIGANAFMQTALSVVTIPASVTQIGDNAFACGIYTQDNFRPTLQTIDVDPENAVFSGADGILFNKDQTELIVYPAANPNGFYEIPDTVTCIDAGAFRNSANLTYIHVPYSVTQIGENAFEGCAALGYLCSDIADGCVETYAADAGIAFRYCDGHGSLPGIAGDADGDGIVDLKDVVLIRRYLAGGWDVTIYGRFADADADNAITLVDVTLITRYLAGGWDVVLQ